MATCVLGHTGKTMRTPAIMLGSAARNTCAADGTPPSAPVVGAAASALLPRENVRASTSPPHDGGARPARTPEDAAIPPLGTSGAPRTAVGVSATGATGDQTLDASPSAPRLQRTQKESPASSLDSGGRGSVGSSVSESDSSSTGVEIVMA